jgi:hypothetical protein
MGLIFKDAKDDQTEAMYEQIHLGNTWQWRYARVKWITTTIIITTVSVVTVAVTDYCLIKFADSAGIIGWLFG